MATITWPSTLPQSLMVTGFGEGYIPNLIRDAFDVGPAGLRRRTTAIMSSVVGQMTMTTEEWEGMQEFIEQETLERSLAFGFPTQGYPAGGEWLVLMDKPPTREALGAEDLWLVTLSFLVLPT